MSKKHPLLPLHLLYSDKMEVVKRAVFPVTPDESNPGSPTEVDPLQHYQHVLKKGRDKGSGGIL
jgi:hypothetical protein